jgi:hypothetical protein
MTNSMWRFSPVPGLAASDHLAFHPVFRVGMSLDPTNAPLILRNVGSDDSRALILEQ